MKPPKRVRLNILGWPSSKGFRTAQLAPMFFGAWHEPASDIEKALKKIGLECTLTNQEIREILSPD